MIATMWPLRSLICRISSLGPFRISMPLIVRLPEIFFWRILDPSNRRILLLTG